MDRPTLVIKPLSEQVNMTVKERLETVVVKHRYRPKVVNIYLNESTDALADRSG